MKQILKRYLYFILGVAINSFGVAFITKSALGTSQISSVPYVLSLRFPSVSFGMTTFFVNLLFILIQAVLLKKNFQTVQFLQVAVNVLFSVLIDVSMTLLSFFQPEAFGLRIVSLLAGCVILAVGISIEVAPDVLVVPGEGAVRAISQTTGLKFGSVKVYFDVSLIVIASALSFLFFGRLNGVGLGTVISALTVGKFVNIVNLHLPAVRKIRDLAASASCPSANFVP
ncbi:Predicted membrane protein [butyrate-producing bacterium SM4/1]|nr:Predicted membrane protein [butyrate-producing bacterium SM4/1]HJG82563.1 DUF6198 family protein [Lacrimispora saccharolytica]